MSRLSELIAELCPDGVEYRALGELLDYEQPSKYIVKSTDYCDNFNVPVLTAGKGLLLGFTNETDGIYNASEDNPVIIFDDFTTSFHWISYAFKVKSSAMKMLRPKQGTENSFRYLYYAMKRVEYVPESHTRQWINKCSKFRIPVPPIEVQREVVRILDEYTAAHDELIRLLHEEMRLCEQQLAMTRNKLLTFSESERVKWATLGELCRIGRGTYITRKEIIPGAVPVILGGMEPAYYHNVSNHEGEAIVVSRSGVNAGYASFWNQPIFVSDGFIIDGSVDGVLLSYVYEVMRSRQKEMIAMNRGSGVPHITGKMLSALRIPVPSIASQKELISTLVGFSAKHKTLIHEISLEESYRKGSLSLVRNHLLSFPEKGA